MYRKGKKKKKVLIFYFLFIITTNLPLSNNSFLSKSFKYMGFLGLFCSLLLPPEEPLFSI